MKSIIFLCVILCMTGCSDSKKAYGEEFIDLINDYNVKPLEARLSPDFVWEHRYSEGHVTNREDFLNRYLPDGKGIKGKFKIKKVLATDPDQFLVEDYSELEQELGIEKHDWIMTLMYDADKKLKKIITDSTDGYGAYHQRLNDAMDKFSEWRKQKYPGDGMGGYADGLILRRAQEYNKAH